MLPFFSDNIDNFDNILTDFIGKMLSMLSLKKCNIAQKKNLIA